MAVVIQKDVTIMPIFNLQKDRMWVICHPDASWKQNVS